MGLGEAILAILAIVLLIGAGLAYVSIANSGGDLSASVGPTTSGSVTASASNSSSVGSGTNTNSGMVDSTSSGASTSGSGTSSGSSGTATINIPQGAGTGLNFSPATLSVAPGTTITFSDQDSTAPHNVDFTSGPSGATLPSVSPNLNKGSTFQVTLSTPGTYDYHCDYHSWMVATITVT